MSIHNLKTLSEVLNDLKKEGFDSDFRVEKGKLYSLNDDQVMAPEEVTLLDEKRFEGNTNPDDASILYMIETKNGRKGTLIDAYGPSSDSEISHFINHIKLHKKQ